MGAYAALGSQSDITGDGAAEMGLLAAGVFSDELKPGDFYVSQTTHEWQFSPDDVGIRDSYTAIDNFYRVIDRVNRVLTALPNASAETASDKDLRTKVKGEALFLRAYAHFELFRYYCKNYDPAGLGMMYMTEPSLKARPRDLMGPYFENILKDIADAKPLMAQDVADVYRANLLSAVGLNARVALYMRNWTEAEKSATEYINALPLASKTEFAEIWTDVSKKELAFKLARTVTAGRVGGIYRGVFAKNAAGDLVAPANILWVPSDKLWNMFDQMNDIRFKEYLIDESILAAVTGKPSKIVNKYRGTGYATTNESVNDIKVFRTAEMYLIRAEARAEQGQFTGTNSGESDLNTLREARINGYTNQTFTSKEALIQSIMDERFKELAFEGHRFWDLKRRGLPIQRLPSDAPTPASATLPANDYHFVLPIPNAEISGNTLIQQNEGYATQIK
ncbi:SusD family protein [compost metagenome]